MTGALKFIAVDSLVRLPRTKNGRQFVVINTDRLSKLTPAILTAETSTSYAVTI